MGKFFKHLESVYTSLCISVVVSFFITLCVGFVFDTSTTSNRVVFTVLSSIIFITFLITIVLREVEYMIKDAFKDKVIIAPYPPAKKAPGI